MTFLNIGKTIVFMDYRYLLFFLLLSQALYAVSCSGYTDIFDARVLDAKYRPIPGAEISVKYDAGTSFGSQYFTTPPRLTDAAGIVHFEIFNQGTSTRTIDCNIVITGSAGGRSRLVTIIANAHGNPVDVALDDVYPVQFYVKDQLRAPLVNASVTLANITKKTGSDGLARYYLRRGNYSYLASFMDGSQAGTLSVADDTPFEVLLSHYAIAIDVRDDFGEPLPATLTIFGTTMQLENGHFENNRTFGENVQYEVRYQGIVKEGVLLPSVEPHVSIIYDAHSPVFGDIVSGTINNRPRLTMNITDPGQEPSGVDFQSLKVTYRLEPADDTTPWSSALAFTTGRSTVAAEFPELPANSIVQFRAEVKDKAGNKATIEGRFSTLAVNATENVTQNQTNTHQPPQQQPGIPMIYTIGGVIIMFLVIYVVFKLRTRPGAGV